MTPIEFKQQTTVFAKDQPQYQPLPAHVSADGVVTSCWALTPEEMARIAITGMVWIQQLTFGAPLQPQLPSVDNPLE